MAAQTVKTTTRSKFLIELEQYWIRQFADQPEQGLWARDPVSSGQIVTEILRFSVEYGNRHLDGK